LKKEVQIAKCWFRKQEALLPKDRKSQFPEGKFPRFEKPFSENKKKLVPKLKKLELNSTTLKLKSKKKCSDHAKKPDPSVSYGLKVKNKAVRVLLDSGSSGSFSWKKGSSKHIFVAKQIVPQLWCLSNGTFVTDKVGDIEVSFVEYSSSKKVPPSAGYHRV
jgi:hypothetical protein